jgi:hypothetical protein
MEWPHTWPDVTGASPRLTLIGFCLESDERGEIVVTRKQIGAFASVCRATVDSCIDTLRITGCLIVSDAGRDGWGSFGPKKYALNLHDRRVKEIFDHFRPARARRIGARQARRSEADIGRAHTGSPGQEIRHAPPKTSPGPYKDSRASSSTSSKFPSLPSDFEISDPQLRFQVMEALGALGQGADPDKVYEIAGSLVRNIPDAIAEGYDFDLDVLPCLKEATSYYRRSLLWSLNIVFERDLPLFRKKRRRTAGSNQGGSE